MSAQKAPLSPIDGPGGHAFCHIIPYFNNCVLRGGSVHRAIAFSDPGRFGQEEDPRLEAVGRENEGLRATAASSGGAFVRSARFSVFFTPLLSIDLTTVRLPCTETWFIGLVAAKL